MGVSLRTRNYRAERPDPRNLVQVARLVLKLGNAVKHLQLMPQHENLGFQPPPGLEAIAQDADGQESNCNHSLNVVLHD